jgi:valyl-tRNA synthetase
MSFKQFDKSYEPHEVEKRWYEYWENEQLFAAEEQSPRKSYAIVIPPPNVTGVLHMGHALNNTMQDILCRYRRLQGDNVLWMPGTEIHRGRLAMAGKIRQCHHQSAQAPGRILRLEAGKIHHG